MECGNQALDFYRVAARHYDADCEALQYSPDVEFYVEMARRSGGPVLEMGCGTGRILLPVARAGMRVHGLDLSTEMLSGLARKLGEEPDEVSRRATFSRGDMRSGWCGGGFALATAPFGVAHSLHTREQQRAWLRNARRHLRPGGALCFDVFQPDDGFLNMPRGPIFELMRADPASGRPARRVAYTAPDHERQVLDVRFEWERQDGDEWVPLSSAVLRMRWDTRQELEGLLESEGFRVTDYWGGFDWEPHNADSREQVIRAVVV